MKNIITEANSSEKNKTGSWRTYKPVIDHNKCIGCGLCAKICPDSCIVMKKLKEAGKKPIVNYDYCKGCGLCAKECPVKAIKMVKDF